MRGIRPILTWQTTLLQLRRPGMMGKDRQGAIAIPIRRIQTRGTIEGAREVEEELEDVGKVVVGEAMTEDGGELKGLGRTTSVVAIRKLIWAAGNTSLLLFTLFSMHD
jgi:hypothetical protein